MAEGFTVSRGIMKRRSTIFCLCWLVMTSGAWAQTQVLSRNAVGYYKLSVDANRAYPSLFCNPFIPLSGLPTPSNLLGTAQLPTGSKMHLWDARAQRYVIEILESNETAGSYWNPDTSLLTLGRGFWITLPSDAPQTSYVVYVCGEVPDQYTAPVVTVPVVQGLNLLGFPYPVDRPWSQILLANRALPGDMVYYFIDGKYHRNTKIKKFKGKDTYWSLPTQVLHVGEGFWFYRKPGNGRFDWVETKPYSWP